MNLRFTLTQRDKELQVSCFRTLDVARFEDILRLIKFCCFDVS
jgi:hypothetical protein